MKRERVKLRSFGDKLKKLRNIRGLTQEKFADEMNISLDTVKNWEQGYNYPSIDTLVDIAEYLKCDFDYLIGQQETPNKEYTHISDMIGISEVAAAQLSIAKGQQSPVLNVLSQLIEENAILMQLYKCASANYGCVSTFVDVVDPFMPSGKHPTLVTPQRVRQADAMDLYILLQKFIDSLRKQYGLPTSEEQ